MPTKLPSLISLNAGMFLNPSTAEITEIGGVIIPSANKAAPPIIAKKTGQGACLLTRANKEKIPPSPLLSARSVSITYLMVVCKVSVQMIQDKAPIMSSSLITLLLQIALNT